MKKLSLAGLGAKFAAVGVAATFLAQPPAFAQTELQTSQPGEGVFCAWAFFSYASEVVSRCHPGEDAEVQQELERSVARFEAYVVANGSPPMTREQIDEFKRSEGMVGAPKEELCRGDADETYRAVAAQGAAEIRRFVDEMVARPGPPTGGECI